MFPVSTSTVFAVMLNDNVPERYRITSLEVACVIDRHDRLSKRELLKVSYRAWAAIGQPKLRGTTLPPWCGVELKMELLMRVIRHALIDIREGSLITEHQIARRLGQYFWYSLIK